MHRAPDWPRRRDRRAFAQIATRDRALERQGRHQVCRVKGATARNHIDQLEVGERHQHRKCHHHRDDRRQQRHGHVTELLPRRGAVEARRLVVRRRDRLQPGQQRDGDERHAAPDVGEDHRPARVPDIAEEVDVGRNEPKLFERPGDDRELAVIEPPERDGRKHGRYDERDQHDRAQQRLERQVLVEQNCEIKPDREFNDARDAGIEQRIEHREPERGVVP